MLDLKPQIQDPKRTPSRVNAKQTTHRHITFKIVN